MAHNVVLPNGVGCLCRPCSGSLPNFGLLLGSLVYFAGSLHTLGIIVVVGYFVALPRSCGNILLILNIRLLYCGESMGDLHSEERFVWMMAMCWEPVLRFPVLECKCKGRHLSDIWVRSFAEAVSLS